MTIPQTSELMPRKPLRLWPGVVAVALQWLAWLILPLVVPNAMVYSFLGAIVCGVVVALWWLFFSRAPWSERVGAIVLMIVALSATSRIVHESVANGMMGMMLPIFAIPLLSLALVSWAVTSRRFSSGLRLSSMAGAILFACGVFALVRTGGITGEGYSDLHWRWTETPEERLLARTGDNQVAPPPAAVATTVEMRLPTPASEAPTAAKSTPADPETPDKRAPAPPGDESTARSADAASPSG